MENRTGFITERVLSKQPVIISVEQQDGETVALVARSHEGGVQYRLGLFKNGRLYLCPVSADALDRMGLQHDVSGRIVVDQGRI